MFPEMGGTPKSSILIGVFHYKPSILGYPYFLETPIYLQKGGGGGLGPSVRDEAVDFFSEL